MKAKNRYEYQDLGTVELPDEINADVERRMEEAEQELRETRVNFRWGKDQVAVVKEAARTVGVPYQTYIKQVVYRQSIQDIKDSKGLVSGA